MFEDTIAAISTAWGEAGIAIIRLSGPSSRTIADRLFRGVKPLSETPPRFMRNGHILDFQGNVIDQVLAVWFRGPKSYTGEDIVEIHCHGGTLVAQTCLDMLLSSGARLAEPGEFTRRAFLNGRMDLPQAESVLGIIRSRSEEALKAALRSLKGELSEFVQEIYDEMLNLSASLEVGIDFPEEDVPLISDEEVSHRLWTLRQSMEDLLDRCTTGLLLREGIRVALIGRPNVGKSSLLNALLKESRAIVTSIPGTTRDIIEEVLTYRGVPLRIVDTAGIGIPSDEVEAIGIKRAEKELERAEVRIWVIDGSQKLLESDMALASRISGFLHVVVINKADLPLAVTEEVVRTILPESPVFIISAQEGKGLEQLKDEILTLVAGGGTLDTGLNATARQVNEIKTAIDSMKQASEALDSGLGQDIAGTCITDARVNMERLIGITSDESLLDTIFKQFCVGK